MEFEKKTYKVYYNYCVGGFSKARDERYQFDRSMPVPTFDDNGKVSEVWIMELKKYGKSTSIDKVEQIPNGFRIYDCSNDHWDYVELKDDKT